MNIFNTIYKIEVLEKETNKRGIVREIKFSETCYGEPCAHVNILLPYGLILHTTIFPWDKRFEFTIMPDAEKANNVRGGIKS